MKRTKPSLTNNQLRILWCLKREGGKVLRHIKTRPSLINWLADETRLSTSTISGCLRDLERACIIVREYQRPVGAFSEGKGRNNLLSIEMIDPQMTLPPVPQIPLAAVVAFENKELAERTAVDPDRDTILEALLDRCLELQQQIDKLQAVVEKLNEENAALHKRDTRKKPPEHLTSRIQEALTPEKWEELRHQAK